MAALWLAGLAAAAMSPPSSDCREILLRVPTLNGAQGITVDDLLALHDMSGTDAGHLAFSPSPDGTQVAVTLRTARPASNDYCLGVAVIEVASGQVRSITAIPAQPVLVHEDRLNQADWRSGVLAPSKPIWSPDSRSLALIASAGDGPQIFVLSAGGDNVRQLGQAPTGVDDARWSADGRTMLFTSRPDLIPARADIAREALAGFHYDDRWMPAEQAAPRTPPVPEAFFRIDLEMPAAAASAVSRNVWEAAASSGEPVTPAGKAMSLVRVDPSNVVSALTVSVQERGRADLSCPNSLCVGARSAWWSRDGRSLYVLRRAGWADEDSEIARWRPDDGGIEIVFRTRQSVDGCEPTSDAIVCMVESASRPPHLIRLDEADFQEVDLFDPNSGWKNANAGEVRRLHWRNGLGLETFGDLVLPPGYDGRTRLPLVVVGYTSRGFLRGGTGDEYPIFPLASAGFAVLSFQNPRDVGELHSARDAADVLRRHFQGWADRRSVDSALMRGLNLLIARGIVDRRRIGLTGFSNGVENATYSLIHHPVFRAVALSHCCDDLVSDETVFGPAMARDWKAFGYPAGGPRTYSIAANAARIRAPILLQLSDEDYLHALESYATLIDAGRTVDLYVYPDEHHLKWQPSHKRAVYARNIAWFSLWLKGETAGSNEIERELIDRWKARARFGDIAQRAQDAIQASTSASSSIRRKRGSVGGPARLQ